MVSKQKSIFDKEPVKVLSRKDQPKTKDEVVPLEESIFALNKSSKKTVHSETLVIKDDFVSIDDTIFCQKKVYIKDIDIDDEDTEFSLHDDEVPFEESIFAKSKKQSSTPFRISSKEIKVDFNEVFKRYKDLYMIEYISNTNRSNMIDANTFNNCCKLLEESRKIKLVNTEIYIIIKRIIKSACTCIEDVFYSYTNMNRTLFDLISELYPSMDTFTMYQVLDRSYVEVIDEFGGKRWQKS